MFERFRSWLSGSFVCRRCGDSFSLLTLGFGEVICPQCYAGEEEFVFLDSRYILNRLLLRFYGRRMPVGGDESVEDALLGQEAWFLEHDIISEEN